MRWLALLSLIALFTPSLYAADACEAILAADHRDASRARDEWRHPCETLAFFDVQPQHTVVEIWPGAGWYTEILAPLLRGQGKLYAAHWSADSPVEYFRNSRTGYDAKLAANPELYAEVEVTLLELPSELTVAPAGSVDRVVSFRNVHSWLRAGNAEVVLTAAYEALKPGGLLGLVQHRARPETNLETMIESGYVTEAKVRALAEAVGFEFIEASEINANAADDRDHPKGVWTLPPSLRMGELDRQRYIAIGESDRMTLKFRKPQ